MDEHVRASVTDGLRLRDVDVLTVQEDGRSGHDDPEILDRAGELLRVLFTQDDDLLIEAARRQRAGERFGGVIYAHQLNISDGECINDLELVAKNSDVGEWTNMTVFLPL
jgi:predicted nuclease of predicted toxin-antitoxin system